MARKRLFHHKATIFWLLPCHLGLLLPKLGVRRLALTGIVADMCVLLTAADAAMRDYRLWVPADATAGETEQQHAAALAS